MAATAPLVNGISSLPGLAYDEVAEYHKLLKLRDEVFRGLHPRLKVPAHALQDASPSQPLTTQAKLAAPPVLNISQQSIQRDLQRSPATQAPSSSEINPVLLTKSDDLVRAELVLKRQRLEKALKEQFEQKRLDARKRPAPAEAKPDFDLAAVLAKAVGTSKTDVTGKDGDGSDSFDENSLYSSRAPDSTPERGGQSPSLENENLVPDPRVQSAVMGAPLEVDADDEYSPRLPRRESPAYSPALDPSDEEEEGEYSPPEAVEQDPAMQNSGYPMLDAQDPRSRQLRRYSDVGDGTRGAGNMRIVRNHITSPLAPQPSRISPLAVTKQPPLQQNQRARRRSPDAQNPRKKRKLDNKGNRKGRRGQSPDVKEENVSPPPFHEVQPLGSARQRPSNADQPIMIDDGPREIRYAPIEQPLPSPARSQIRYAEPPMPLSEPRVMSRNTMRPMRDNQDLRRVASMHNVRAEMAEELDAYGTPTRSRVASYRESSPIVRQVLDDPYDRQPLQEVRVSRTPGPVYRDPYGQDTHVRYEPMPPPPIERIVVDEYGRRFREIIEQRSPAVPRAGSVRPVDPVEYDPYRPQRAGSVFVDAPERRHEHQQMPPPPPIYRQEAPRPSAVPVGREYGQPQMRSASVMGERALRQPMYVDDRVELREPVRMSSVRPPAPYEEMAREAMVRATSVRPAGRESVYMPAEQPRYRVEQPGQRYFDEHGREIIMQRY